MPRLILFGLLVALLGGCAAPTLVPSVPSTPLPTGAPQPSQTPTSTPSLAPTFTPTPAVFSDSLGVSQDFAANLKNEGINSTISRENNNWLIKTPVISGWNQDGIKTTEQNVKIVSFENVSVHDGGYPDGILKGTDSQGKPVFWSESEKAWVRPLEISSDIEKPTFFPWGKQYLAIESALLNPALNASFPDEAVKNFAGWDIVSEIDLTTQSRHAYLRSLNNQSIRWALDENNKPVWFTTTLPDITVYESVLIQLLNPADPKNPKANETMFVLATMGEWWQNINPDTYRTFFKALYMSKGEDFTQTFLPQIEVAQKNGLDKKGWNASHSWGPFPTRPSVDSLLSQPENSLDNLKSLGYQIKSGLDDQLKSAPLSLKFTDYPDLFKNFILLENSVWALSFTTK